MVDLFSNADSVLSETSQVRQAVISSSKSLPPDVRLVAAVSRLIDLHQSRRESGAGVYVPEVGERAGYLLSAALFLLDTLREMESERGPSFVPVGDVLSLVRQRISGFPADDLDYVIDTLAREREICYGVEDGHGGIGYGITKESTPLIEKAKDFAQIQLSENGRLLLRVAALKEGWLYSDIDAEKLIKAIERGQFEDIPRFCRLMVLEIATKNKQLSSALERPTLAALRDMLISEGRGISESMHDAVAITKKACALIFDVRTREAFSVWKLHNPVPYELGNLQTEVELVMHERRGIVAAVCWLPGDGATCPGSGQRPVFLPVDRGGYDPAENGAAGRPPRGHVRAADALGRS